MKEVVVLFVFLLGLVHSACPNACSGNGVCGMHDSCTCYSNFKGGDCSERVCLYGKAWAAAPNGDLNLDGDLFDSTQYADEYRFTSSAYYLATDSAPGGTWETWPSTHSTTKDEGHFYMECSNKGLCNRNTGLCQCFPGYEGGACSRRSCPNDCSGNGVCLSVSQLLTDYNTEYSASREYKLWDSDLSRSCKCDPGFTGADCSLKQCPVGDDPLTTYFQIDETQWIDIYATSTKSAGGEAGLGGTASLTFTDELGKKWTTDPISIAHYDGSTSANQMATDLKNALENLPAKVIPEVSVSAGFCEQLLNGGYTDFASDEGSDPTAPYYLRCPSSESGGKKQEWVVVLNDKSVYINQYAGSGDLVYTDETFGATAGTGSAAAACYKIANPECVRFKIQFLSNPGDIPDLEVDVSSVTFNGKTDEQDNTNGITSVVTDELDLSADTMAFDYKYTATEVQESTASDAVVDSSARTINFGATVTPGGGLTFPKNTKIGLYCLKGGDEHYLGQYTCATTTDSGNTITVVEYIANPNAHCASAGDNVKVVKLTEYIYTEKADWTHEDLVGMAVEFTGFGESVKQKVGSVQFDPTDQGYILLEGVTSLTGDTTGTGLKIYGKGTKEQVECSDRGLCNRGTGLCQCFRGYKGEACEIQNALAQ